MPYFTSPVDSTRLFYRYYEPGEGGYGANGRPASELTLVFLHGWPMSSDMYTHLMVPLCQTYGIRCIAPDRRGFGKSDWNNGERSVSVTWQTFVDDTLELLKLLQVKNFVMVGASMGCPEALMVHLHSSFVQEQCKGFVFMGPAMPYPVQCPEAPTSSTIEYLDSILEAFRLNRAEFVSASLPSIFAMEAGNKVSPKTLERFEAIIHEADAMAIETTAQILRKSTEQELREFVARDKQVPMLILHGDSDSGSPVEVSSALVKGLVPWAELRVYENAGHGLYLTHAAQALEGILGFVDAVSKA